MKKHATLVLQWALALSAGIHAGLAPEHLSEMPRVGESFVVCAIAMSLLVLRPQPLLALATLGGSLAAWLLAITSGIPFLMDGPEPVEQIAVVTKVAEGVGIAAALVLIALRIRDARRGVTVAEIVARRPGALARRRTGASAATPAEIARTAEQIARRALTTAAH